MAQNLPEVEGFLMYREGAKKTAWKKQYCLLRKSGLYFSQKGKSVVSPGAANDEFINTTRNHVFLKIGQTFVAEKLHLAKIIGIPSPMKH